MNIFRRCLLIILSFWLLAIILPERAEAEQIRRYRRRRTKSSQGRVHTKKNYRYIRSHDFNDDGVVDARDRLIWLEKNKNSGVVYITNDNRDLTEVMDVDGNNQRRLTNNAAEDRFPDWFDPAFARPVSPAGKLGATWGWLKQNSE